MTAGSIVWLTGLPASGKTTLAWRARAKLAARGISAVVLDGDEVRQCLVPRPGHAAEEREAFYETLARLFAQAAAGAVSGLPGFDVEYEPPVAAELVAKGGLDDDAVSALVDWAER